MHTTKARILRCTKGVTIKDKKVSPSRIKFEMRPKTVAPVIEKIQENRLRLFAHVKRQLKGVVATISHNTAVAGRRPKMPWCCHIDADRKSQDFPPTTPTIEAN